ncbi:MAG: heme anaerobic degradation radical SAM methyltransferase ChuW/HutW [Negativicutes bacterium]|nr:heme anaerobic degradation radical SAM methyltransferase ChuW/HutW [Negativicutes bacterium]
MHLEDYFLSLDEERKKLLLGNETENPLCYGFDSKRTVHAGLDGTAVMPEKAQPVWKQLLEQPVTRIDKQALYIHIPFCQTKCLYCAFFQNATNQNVEDYYIDCLIKEIRSACNSRRIKDGIIHTVFLGGGTPSSLSPANAARLLREIKTCFNLANDYEMTMEGRIHDLTPPKIEAWLQNGVNRVSLGVQSFNTKVRQQLGRIDSKEEILQNLKFLRAQQQCAIVVDLIYGLPDQTMQIWEEDLELLEQVEVDGMDLYQLNVYENSDLNKAIKMGRMAPAATTAQQAEMFSFAHEYVSKRPYTRLSACHWRRDNRERSLYNTLAKQGCTIFPFGCGAGGKLDGYSMMQQRNIKAYEDLVAAGQKPLMTIMRQSPLQPITNAVLGQIEQGYLDLQKLMQINEQLAELKELFELWENRGFLTFNGVIYRLTVAGQFWQVNLAQSILECIQVILLDKDDTIKQDIAAQDTAHPGKSNPARDKLMKVVKEMYPQLSASKAVEAVDAMPEHVKIMLGKMTESMIKQMIKSMGADRIEAMMNNSEE